MSKLLVSVDDIHGLTETLTTAADALSASSLTSLALTNQGANFASASVLEALGASASIQRLRIELTATGIEKLALSGDQAAARMLMEDAMLAGLI